MKRHKLVGGCSIFLVAFLIVIVGIYANKGPVLKRLRARPRGRAGRIIKRSSHITVVVDEETT